MRCNLQECVVVGGGLAGCEAAWQLARAGLRVVVVEQRPVRTTGAHTTPHLAELVCSNSLRAERITNAVGLLKAEMRLCGSLILACADETRVPAGGALAVDRLLFAKAVESRLASHPAVRVERRCVDELPDESSPAVVATGPLTSGSFAEALERAAGCGRLHFYDAIAPIVETDSLDLGQLFAASRYGRGEPDDYLNAPLDEESYHRFVDALLRAPKVTPHGFEDRLCFEGCLPIEVMAARGPEVLAHGPMKPVGLIDPRTGRRPYAVVQLRREDRAGTARNMVGFQTRLTQAAQREIFRSLPGFARARFVRYGSVHRNTYLDAPEVLADDLSLRAAPHIFLAGQVAGTEGYVEAAASGLLASVALVARLRGRRFVPPPAETALGGLYRHLRGAWPGPYTPSNVVWAMIDTSNVGGRSKLERRRRAALRALEMVRLWWRTAGLGGGEAEPVQIPPRSWELS